MIDMLWDGVSMGMEAVLALGLILFCGFVVGFVVIGAADLIMAMLGLGRYRLRDQRARHNRAILHSASLERELGLPSTEAQMRRDYDAYWEEKENSA